MSLFKHAMVSGINDALVDRGIVSWPNEAVGFEVCSKIAADLSGPDMLPEGGLANESALVIGAQIKEASDALIAEGYGPDASAVLRTKQAAAMDFSDRAAWVAEACMSKAAAEASLTSVGPNTAESAVQTDQHAALDQHNRATNKYLMGVGRTAFPSGGVVGQQMVHPERQNGPSISNSLTSLDKQADYNLDEILDAPPAAAGQPGRIRAALADAGKGIADYGRSALTNPFADARARGAVSVLKSVGKHPATHAAALAAALYGTSKAIPAIRRRFADDAKDSAQFMQQVADGGNEEMAEYLAHKQANEDMSAADLSGAEEPGRMARAMMFLQGLKNKLPGFRPSPEAQVAAAGLGEAGTPGMEVMAHVLDTVKTAADAEDVLQQILHHQGEAGALASPELVEAIEHMMAQEGDEPSSEDMEEQAKTSGERFDRAKEYLKGHAEKGVGAIKDMAGKHPRAATGAKVLAGTAALAGTAYGAKKLYDKYKSKQEMSSEEKKEAALLDYLKAAAEGSLTDVGENTEESAAHTDSVAELDMRNRAPGEYLTGVGNTRMPNKGQVYAVEPADQDSPVHTDNLPTNETKSAEFAYVNNFRKIASELGPYLPATMGRDEKVAHLQTLMGMPPSERSGYLKALRAG